MKIIQKRHRIGKKAALAIVVALLAISGVVGYRLLNSNSQKSSSSQLPAASDNKLNNVNTGTPTSDQTKAGNDAKKDTISQPSSAPKETPFTTTITAANQNGGLLQIRSLISALSNSGVCELTLSKGTKTITKTIGVQANANSSTCKGFDIPTSELSSGDWNITLKVTIGTQSSTATKTVTVS